MRLLPKSVTKRLLGKKLIVVCLSFLAKKEFTKEENEAIKVGLKDCFIENRPGKKDEINEAKEKFPVLRGRDWKAIKYRIETMRKSNKKK